MTPFRLISSFVLLLLTFILIARSYTARSVSLPPAAYCGYPDSPASPLVSDTIQLQLWAVAYGQYCGRAFGPVAAARRIVEQKIAVIAKPLSILSETFRPQFVQLAQAGAAPDITIAGVRELAEWSKHGYIVPLDQCRSQHSQFNDVIDQLWSTQMRENHATYVQQLTVEAESRGEIQNPYVVGVPLTKHQEIFCGAHRHQRPH